MKEKKRICHGEKNNKIACNQEMTLAGGWEYTQCKRCINILKKSIKKRIHEC
jgi:hypothetical protein